MKILYIGRHGNFRSNDDEGAIAKSLHELGVHVNLVQEHRMERIDYAGCDLVLFHHCPSLEKIRDIPLPKVFWYFDRVEWDDPLVEPRNARRREWIANATELATIGFCTDGDWVAKDTTGKLNWLMQGFNQYLKPAPPSRDVARQTILFTGGRRGGSVRESFVEEMSAKYPNFVHVERGCHGDRLAQAIANAAVVVAPDSPITDRYWSNRVYLTMGLGGFLLHPITQGLAKDYDTERGDITFYASREDLHGWIEYYLNNVEERDEYRRRGQYQTLQHHTYKHRCQTLLALVKEKVK